jgi:predicted secreted protein
MSDAVIGTGVSLAYGNGASPDVFTEVEELVTLTPPPETRNEIDVSTHNAGVEEKILGMKRTGQVQFTINYVPSKTSHAAIRTFYNANTERTWRIIYPDSPETELQFEARVQSFSVNELTTDAPIQAQCALTINGAITVI